MDSFISFFSSVNKIAILAFCIVSGFLVYEIILYKKGKEKEKKPSVPQFTPTQTVVGVTAPVQAASPIQENNKHAVQQHDEQPKTLIVIGVLTIVIIIGVFLYFLSLKLNEKKIKVQPIPIVQEVSSAGLKVFSKDWIEIKNDGKVASKVRPGEMVYIGIHTIEEADIDRARIKVNTANWEIKDITTSYNAKLKVYYKEYVVATGTAQLKIDAQLHSASDGWLGE